MYLLHMTQYMLDPQENMLLHLHFDIENNLLLHLYIMHMLNYNSDKVMLILLQIHHLSN